VDGPAVRQVQEILKEFDQYKPLTLRQVYYQLVGKGYIENKVSEYTMLSNLIKWARIDKYIPWKDIEDRTRAFHDLSGWTDKDHFIDQELNNLLYGYRRDLLQGQDKYIELWIEKDALSSIFAKVANPYTVPVVVCKGFSSVSFLNDFRDRLSYQDKHPIMLYFGDFDPSGVEMLTAMETTLEDELEVSGIEFKRIALLKEDIFEYNLPHNPGALKRADTRAKKHVMTHGELAVELDALRPDVLEGKIRKAIEGELDARAFNIEVKKHDTEIDKLNKLRQKIKTFVLENR
jgi:hypothetical protein